VPVLVFEVLPVVGKVSQAKLSLALDVDADPTDLLKAHIFFSSSFIERREKTLPAIHVEGAAEIERDGSS